MRLQLLHPQIAARDCSHCQQFVYDETTGESTTFPRPPGTFAPCRYGENRCPKGTPETSRQLSDKNQRAYRHYLTCKAIGQFPDDSVVHRHAAVIRMMEAQMADMKHQELMARLISLSRLLGEMRR